MKRVLFIFFFCCFCVNLFSQFNQSPNNPKPYGITAIQQLPQGNIAVRLYRNGNTPETVKVILFRNKRRVKEIVTEKIQFDWQLKGLPASRNYYMAVYSIAENRLLGQTQYFTIQRSK